jgi:hypothetical protein
MGRPKKVITAPAQVENKAPETGETTAAYFRRVFQENPHLLSTTSNDELLTRWLSDHPGEKEVPPNVKKHMGNVKSILRHKGRKEVAKPKTVEHDRALPSVSTPLKLTRIAPKGLEALEEQIDDCLTVAKHMDREGLDDVIRLLRNARNAGVWKLGA